MNLWVENRCPLAPLSCIKRGPLFCKTTNFEEAFALFNGNKWPLLDPEKMQLLLHNWILRQSSYSWKMPSGMFQKLRWMVSAVSGVTIKKVIGAYFGILRQELHSYWPHTKSLAHRSNSVKTSSQPIPREDPSSPPRSHLALACWKVCFRCFDGKEHLKGWLRHSGKSKCNKLEVVNQNDCNSSLLLSVSVLELRRSASDIKERDSQRLIQ